MPPGSNHKPLWVRAGIVSFLPLLSGCVQGFPEQPPVVDYGRQRRPGGLRRIRSPVGLFLGRGPDGDCDPGWLYAEVPARVTRGIPDHRHLCPKTGRMCWTGQTRLLEGVEELCQIALRFVLVAERLTFVLITERLLSELLLNFGARCLCELCLGQSLYLLNLVTLVG